MKSDENNGTPRKTGTKAMNMWHVRLSLPFPEKLTVPSILQKRGSESGGWLVRDLLDFRRPRPGWAGQGGRPATTTNKNEKNWY